MKYHYKSGNGPMFKYFEPAKNVVLQLIFFIAILYIIVQIVNISLIIVFEHGADTFEKLLMPYLAISDWQHLLKKPWTVFSYAFIEPKFMALLGNMIWLYIFGQTIQAIMGRKEIIPLFIITTVLSALIYLSITAFVTDTSFTYILGSLPGVVSIAFAALTLSPKYRFYIGSHFSFPMWVAVIVFIILSGVLLTGNNPFTILLYIISAGIGFGYMKLLTSGYKVGTILHNKFASFNANFGSKSKKHDWVYYNDIQRQKKGQMTNEEEIDAILDKINEKGIDTLSAVEKKKLMDASKNNH